MMHVHLSGQMIGCPSILFDRKFNMRHCLPNVQPNAFMLAMVISIIYHYHFILLSVACTIVRGCKVSGKAKVVWFSFQLSSQLIGIKFVVGMTKDKICCGDDIGDSITTPPPSPPLQREREREKEVGVGLGV